jgi:hypothetical protein
VAHDQLRHLLHDHIGGLRDLATHAELPSLCARLGLSPPPTEQGVSKRDRLFAALDATPNHMLLIVAQKYIDEMRPPAAARNRLQDIICSDDVGPKISKRIRREIAQALHGKICI